MNWVEVGKFLCVAGLILVVIGAVFMVYDKIPIGRLPGDIQIGTSKFKIYIPVVTCIFLSVALTLIINFFSRR
jgi:hypothetical protein